jgi:signal peptidase I
MKLPPRLFATVRRIVDCLLIWLILLVLFGVVLGRIVPLTGRTTLIIGGGSMEPALPIGTAVVVDPVIPSNIHVGDVVSLRSGANLKSIFTHRVTRIVPRDDAIWIETKGDANKDIDPAITSTEHVIGRVSMAIPYAGFLLALLSAPSGILFVVCLAIALLLLVWLLESFEVDTVAARAPTPSPPAPTPAAPTVVPAGAVMGGAGPIPGPGIAPPRSRSNRGARAQHLRRARHAVMDPLPPGE